MGSIKSADDFLRAAKLLTIPGQPEPFHHTDGNRLRKIAEPTPNPTALAAQTIGMST